MLTPCLTTIILKSLCLINTEVSETDNIGPEPKDHKEVVKILEKNSVHYDELGSIIDKEMIINQKTKVTIDELKSCNTNWLNKYMS